MTTVAFEIAWTADPVDETIRREDAAAIQNCPLDHFEIAATLWRWATGHGPRV